MGPHNILKAAVEKLSFKTHHFHARHEQNHKHLKHIPSPYNVHFLGKHGIEVAMIVFHKRTAQHYNGKMTVEEVLSIHNNKQLKCV